MTEPTRILMVCLGNVCRSPTAEVVLRHRVEQAGLGGLVLVDSAGTHASNSTPRLPDARSIAHAARRGYDLRGVRSRRVSPSDFESAHLILAMDEDNRANLATSCPPAHQHKIRLLMSYAPAGAPRVVPDPYYGAAAGFEQVLDLVETACDGLIETLHRQMGLVDR